jgi:hypothetical protein
MHKHLLRVAAVAPASGSQADNVFMLPSCQSNPVPLLLTSKSTLNQLVRLW